MPPSIQGRTQIYASLAPPISVAFLSLMETTTLIVVPPPSVLSMFSDAPIFCARSLRLDNPSPPVLTAEPGTKPQSASTLPIIQALTPELAAKGWVVSGYSLRMIITTWLDKFTLGFADVDSEADQLIVQSGIYDRMRNGNVEVAES